jgi:hypothetical protein
LTPDELIDIGVGAQDDANQPISLQRPTVRLRRITFSNPPVDLIVPEAVSRLHDVVKELSEDAQVQVVFFASSVSGYLFNRFNPAEAGGFPILPCRLPVPAIAHS